MPLIVLLFRLFRRARRQPPGRLLVVLIVTLAVVALIRGIEAAGWWPDWAQRQGGGRLR